MRIQVGSCYRATHICNTYVIYRKDLSIHFYSIYMYVHVEMCLQLSHFSMSVIECWMNNQQQMSAKKSGLMIQPHLKQARLG